ncbi:hypothetical protein TNIN_358741 [Trichonephila inaurata madagascariensis]|uniref:Uncharacterized protein n=1 Tax=Trichonephila inaurata madagascariensis TaxID=2747483 RepID=A0A8X6MKQ3_9ARAC|nr:hypothetical protein TNIN_358741 [Trichonephila inaurata madagascariensis]
MSTIKSLKKDELLLVAEELGLDIPQNPKIIELKKLIESSEIFETDKEFLQSVLDSVLAEKNAKIEQEKSKLESEKAKIEFEKIKKEQLKIELELTNARCKLSPVQAKSVTSVFLSNVNETKCSYCCENHAISFCAKFKQLSVNDRIEFVKKQRLCFLCLRVGCTASKCKAKPCKLCAKRHHVSLHFPKQNTNFLTNENKSNAFHPSTQSRLNADARVFNPTAYPLKRFRRKIVTPCLPLINIGREALACF